MNKTIDILIVGGGLIGASLLLALQSTGLRVLLIDTQPLHSPSLKKDTRTLVLSKASLRILDALGILPSIVDHASPILNIHVSKKGAFGHVLLQAPSHDPFGLVLEMEYLKKSLSSVLTADNILSPGELVDLDKNASIATVRTNDELVTIHAKLIVAADGAHSKVRQLCGIGTEGQTYPHQALVATVQLARSHNHYAYERFTPNGPLALLPLPNHSMGLIWSLAKETAARLVSASNKDFLKTLQAEFGYRVGRFIGVNERASFPLMHNRMDEQIAWPVVFVGNAAHTLHPVAGQGFNLGLRDIAELAALIHEQGLTPAMLKEYEQKRKWDQALIYHCTKQLVATFTQPFLNKTGLHSLGLVLLNELPGFKTLLAQYASGFAPPCSKLICNIPLENVNESI